MTDSVLFRNAEVAPEVHLDLRMAGGVIAHRGHLTVTGADTVVDLDGRALLPGLVDHHVHLRALAAAASSIDCSPQVIGSVDDLVAVLRTARSHQRDGWLRGVGYDVAKTGPVDRSVLDRSGAGAVRVQDRTAAWWLLNSEALDRVLPADRAAWPEGVCTDAAGRPTGVLVRLDGWLRERLGPQTDLGDDLPAVGRRLASWGVTAVHDATVTNRAPEVATLGAAGLPQRLTVMTGSPDAETTPGVDLGPVKIVLDDPDLPDLPVLTGSIRAAHGQHRPVAIHCVTRVQLLLAAAALEEAGTRAGDRLEHASVVPADAVPSLARLGVTIVTQPGLVWSRGDRYLEELERDDQDSLYRVATLRQAGVRVLGSSDAPFGPADPWLAIRAAIDRRTSTGRLVAPDEAVGARAAVGLFTGNRRLRPGEPADLCVLDATWKDVGDHPPVRATFVGGRPIHP